MSAHISGFPELLPHEQLVFEKTLRIIKEHFSLYGFCPLETPAVERASTLLSKGNDSEIYGLFRLCNPLSAQTSALALRFDLTVPLARYLSCHENTVVFPYKRYHVGPVWRGERPQAGRYRQFHQCDIDIVDTLSTKASSKKSAEQTSVEPSLEPPPKAPPAEACTHTAKSDGEVVAVMGALLGVLGFERFVIHINHREVLAGLLRWAGKKDHEIPDTMRLIDKVEKVSSDVFVASLVENGLHHQEALFFLSLAHEQRTPQEWLSFLRSHVSASLTKKGTDALEALWHILGDFQVPLENISFSPCLARGLSYYTGMVCEAKLLDFLELGSICGGGRYGDLLESFGKKGFSGVGLSLGLSRLMPALMKKHKTTSQTSALALVTVQEPSLFSSYSRIAHYLRQHNIPTELYLGQSPLSAQTQYANKKGFPFVIFANAQEIKAHQWIVRSFQSGDQCQGGGENIVDFIRQRADSL